MNGMIFANSESYMLPEAFHPVSAQEKSWLKNSKIAVKGMAIFCV